MGKFTQGALINNCRSSKYSEIPCFFLIISANCDITNCKVNKFYSLIAIEIDKWFISNVGFEEVILKNLEKKIQNQIKKLDWEKLKEFSLEDCEKVLKDTYSSSFNDIYDQIKQYKKYVAASIEDRKKILQDDDQCSKWIMDFLNNIYEEKLTHLTIISDNGKYNSSDLIVDLQEIDSLTVDEVEDIIDSKIDRKRLGNNNDKYDKRFFINNSDDFVTVISNIKSPRLEHIMQRFSNAFIRIGINRPDKEYIKKIYNKITNKVDLNEV